VIDGYEEGEREEQERPAAGRHLPKDAYQYQHGCTYKDYRRNRCPDQPSSPIMYWELLLNNPRGATPPAPVLPGDTLHNRLVQTPLQPKLHARRMSCTSTLT
jgi:hypothetical protein